MAQDSTLAALEWNVFPSSVRAHKSFKLIIGTKFLLTLNISSHLCAHVTGDVSCLAFAFSLKNAWLNFILILCVMVIKKKVKIHINLQFLGVN